ncbi:MAG: Gfo/Idh/MocA family oxidoreductase, partial [Bacteroidota bacterium]|nr:Gfo/Idh/MocA family oxidoreductase [Bacteroidota bacterium]
MISFAIIGYGKIGERHAEVISQHADAKLIGAYDIKEDRMEVFENKYPGLRYYTSLEQLLDDPNLDIIVICTPNNTHAQLSIEALQAGKNVLVEKPMAIRKIDCENMIHMSLKTGKSLFVVKQNRFNPPVQA